jgi:hypothetical protein
MVIAHLARKKGRPPLHDREASWDLWICDEFPVYGRQWHYLALIGTLREGRRRSSPAPLMTSDRIPYPAVHFCQAFASNGDLSCGPPTLSL